MQLRSHNTAPDNIYLNNTLFTPYLEEYTNETLIREPVFATESNNNTIMPSHPVHNVQENPSREGSPVSEVIKRPDFEEV